MLQQSPSSWLAHHHPSPKVYKTLPLCLRNVTSLALFFGTNELDQQQHQINLHLFAFKLILSGFLCQQKWISMGDHKGRWVLSDWSLSPKWTWRVLTSLMSNHREKWGVLDQLSYKDWIMAEGNVIFIRGFYCECLRHEASRISLYQ